MPSLRFSWLPLVLYAGLLVVGCRDVPAQDSGGVLPPEQAAYDVTHYDLNVTVHPAQRYLRGHVTVEADVTDSLRAFVLNLDRRLEVTDAQLLGAPGRSLPVERRADGNERWMALPGPRAAGDDIRVRVAYQGRPREAPNPPWKGGLTWARTPAGAPWVATSGQTAGADLWWPVKDHPGDEPDSMDIALTVPDTLVAASNGVLRSVDAATDSTETYRWHVSTSINPYAVTMNVAPYAALDTTYTSTAGTRVPVTFYALPSDTARARAALPGFLDQVRFLEETLGPYPFRNDKYGVAQTPFLGMEHQTLIAYGHDFRDGGLGYDAPFDALHFHELAHEWYGNCLTVRDWKDFWIHEGTATYLEALYEEALQGPAAYHERVDYFRRQVTGRTPIARRSPTSAQSIYGREVYFKGALVLHTLRSMIGREATEALLRRFVDPPDRPSGSACRHVDTEAFLQAAESRVGRSLDAFASTYLYQSALPRLDSTRTDGRLRLQWADAAEGFAVPVPVRVNGETRSVSMEDGKGQLAVPPEASVHIDPRGWVLRRQ
jgi:aminopeptidase N